MGDCRDFESRKRVWKRGGASKPLEIESSFSSSSFFQRAFFGVFGGLEERGRPKEPLASTLRGYQKKRKSSKAANCPQLGSPLETMVSEQPSGSAYVNLAVRGKGKEVSNLEQLSGFIFICNGKTKPECYQYRVFGLPIGKKEVVERIKIGTKLFLFDFEKKLLYGIYEASSGGKLNLEPCAFGGRFPAQVKFKICKDCYPLPESSFRPAIQDNYQNGTKFKQELSDHQVRSLLTLFRSFTSPLFQHMPPRLLDVNRPRVMQCSETQHALMREPQNDSYRRALITGHASSMVELQLTPTSAQPHGLPHFAGCSVSPLQHPYSGMTGQSNPPIEPQALQNLREQFFSGIQLPLIQGGLLQPVRYPYHNNSSSPSYFQGSQRFEGT